MATLTPPFLNGILDINWSSYLLMFVWDSMSLFYWLYIMSRRISFRTAHSVTTPIHTLPNELILEIFMLNATFEDCRTPRLHIKTTIACSQVCYRWRYLSLTSPAIWALCLDFAMSEAWTQAILERSGTRGLSIEIPSYSRVLERRDLQNYTNLADDLRYPGDPLPSDLSLFSRCNRLDLQLCRQEWIHFFPELEQYLPHIEDIAFTSIGHANGFSVDTSIPWRVKTLELEDIMLPLHIPGLFQCLNSLTVEHLPSKLRYTYNGWLNILENLPQLKVLYLRQAFIWDLEPSDHRYDIAPSSNAPIRLPNLNALHCKVRDIGVLNAFLQKLSIKSDCSLALKTILPDLGPQFEMLCNYLQDLTLNPSFDRNKIHSMFISLCAGSFFELTIREEPSPQKPHPLPFIHIQLCWLGGVCQEKLLSDLLKALGVACACVKEVDVDFTSANPSALVDIVGVMLVSSRLIPELCPSFSEEQLTKSDHLITPEPIAL